MHVLERNSGVPFDTLWNLWHYWAPILSIESECNGKDLPRTPWDPKDKTHTETLGIVSGDKSRAVQTFSLATWIISLLQNPNWYYLTVVVILSTATRLKSDELGWSSDVWHPKIKNAGKRHCCVFQPLSFFRFSGESCGGINYQPLWI